MKLKEEIEVKIQQLKDELKRQLDQLSSTNSNIKKLRAEKKIIFSNVSKIEGAVQAYFESIRLFDIGNSEKELQPVSER